LISSKDYQTPALGEQARHQPSQMTMLNSSIDKQDNQKSSIASRPNFGSNSKKSNSKYLDIKEEEKKHENYYSFGHEKEEDSKNSLPPVAS
jgi:hypothetical protein